MVFKAVSTLILFGLSIAAIGGMWMLMEQGIVSEVIDDYWIANDYLDVIRIEWQGLPVILFVVGIITAIIGVVASKKEVVG